MSSRFLQFLRDTRGNFAITAAVSLLAFGGMAGLALDYSRVQAAKSDMANALDSAIIATAAELNQRDMTSDEARAYLKDFLESNLEDENLRFIVRVDSVNVDWNKESVRAIVRTNLPMTLGKLVGWNVMPIRVRSVSQFGAEITEVAMAFDVTGSMRGRKLRELKDAARSAVGELMKANSHRRERMRISMVPYATAVNAGEIAGFGGNNQRPDDCMTERLGAHQYTDASPALAEPYRDPRLPACPDLSLVPLTSDRGKLNRAIARMHADGWTAGHIGIAWAWYTIAPQWSVAFDQDSQPGPYEVGRNKYAIIMTDGEFNTAFADVPTSERYNRQSGRSMANAIRICDEMKSQGIKVYTIGFELRDRSAIDTMRACASPNDTGIGYFHLAGNGEQLREIYSKIAEQIRTVRLVR